MFKWIAMIGLLANLLLFVAEVVTNGWTMQADIRLLWVAVFTCLGWIETHTERH